MCLLFRIHFSLMRIRLPDPPWKKKIRTRVLDISLRFTVFLNKWNFFFFFQSIKNNLDQLRPTMLYNTSHTSLQVTEVIKEAGRSDYIQNLIRLPPFFVDVLQIYTIQPVLRIRIRSRIKICINKGAKY